MPNRTDPQIGSSSRRLLIILPSLCAEGTPVLTLQLCRYWQKKGVILRVVTLCSAPDDLASEFNELNIPVSIFEIGQGYGRYWRLLALTYQLCRENCPDAVLSMPLGWHAFMAWGARLSGVKLFCAHVGNLPPYWTGSAFKKFRWQIQLGRPVTSQLICCSNYVRQGVLKYFAVRESETTTIYNGCSVEQFSNLSKVRNHDSYSTVPIIGMVARLEVHKDQPTLIRAAKLLKEKGLVFIVQLIGEGSRRSEYESLIDQLGVNDCVHLLGMRRDIPQLLNRMSVFVFSAKPDEGLGVALLEAMTAEVPIVATDVGACQEVLEDGKCGVLVKPNEPVALANAIETALTNPDATKQRVKRAKERVLSDFSLENMAHGYAQCLGLLR